MTTTATNPGRAPAKPRPSRPARQAGYVLQIVFTGVFLWIAYNIVEWGWFGWITEDWADVLPIITLSATATIVANALWILFDDRWFKKVGDLVLLGLSIGVFVTLWRVYPFDFGVDGGLWDIVTRSILGLGLFGMGVAALVGLIEVLSLPFRDEPAQ